MVIAPTHPCPWRLGNRIQRQNTYGVQLSIGIADIFQIAHLDTTRHPVSGAAGRDGCDFCWGAIYLWSGQIIVCHPPWFPSKGDFRKFPSGLFFGGRFWLCFRSLQFDQISSVYRWCLNLWFDYLVSVGDPQIQGCQWKGKEHAVFVFLQERPS